MAQRFTRTDRNRTGNYCEALARAAFIASGAAIALPAVGTQPGWDLLVDEGEGWKKVQVKSASQTVNGGKCCVTIGRAVPKGATPRHYQPGDFDVLIAVLPETGTIWKLDGPSIIEAQKRHLMLDPTKAWMNGQEKAEMPTLTFHQVAPVYVPQKPPVLRRYLRENTGPDRPDFIAEDTWGMLQRFRDGMPARAVAAVYGIKPDQVRGRIERAAANISRRGGPKAPPTCYGHQRGPIESLRDRLLTLLPTHRPDYISESTWSILVRWSEGESQRSLAKEAGGVSDRIWSAIKALERHMDGTLTAA